MALFGGITFEKGQKAVTGIKELDRKLARLSKTGSKKAVRSGMNAGTTLVVKELRSLSGSVSDKSKGGKAKAALRKSVGKKLKIVNGLPDMKVGFGVGKKKPKVPEERSRPGRGISPQNINWFLFGAGHGKTAGSKNPRRKDTTGASTGQMPPQITNADQLPVKALKKTKSKIMDAFAKQVKIVIAKEVKKG